MRSLPASPILWSCDWCRRASRRLLHGAGTLDGAVVMPDPSPSRGAENSKCWACFCQCANPSAAALRDRSEPALFQIWAFLDVLAEPLLVLVSLNANSAVFKGIKPECDRIAWRCFTLPEAPPFKNLFLLSNIMYIYLNNTNCYHQSSALRSAEVMLPARHYRLHWWNGISSQHWFCCTLGPGSRFLYWSIKETAEEQVSKVCCLRCLGTNRSYYSWWEACCTPRHWSIMREVCFN